MMYSKLITAISDSDFDVLYASSEPYILEGNLGTSIPLDSEGVAQDGIYKGFHVKNTLKNRLHEMFKTAVVFELREVGTDVLLMVQSGTVDAQGTFDVVLSFFGPDASGSLAWAYAPPSNSVVEELMKPTGIQRIILHPRGDNMVKFILAMGGTRMPDDEDGMCYRTPWGWDGFPDDEYVET